MKKKPNNCTIVSVDNRNQRRRDSDGDPFKDLDKDGGQLDTNEAEIDKDEG